MAILESLLLDIYWVGRVPLILQVILTAKMVLHLLDAESQINVSELSRESGVSRQTLYTWGHRAIAVLGMACIPNLSQTEVCHEVGVKQTEITELREQVRHLQERNQELEEKNLSLQSEVERLNFSLKEIVDKAIVVLRLSGKVSYRGIEECIRLIFGVHVPPYVIEGALSQAASSAEAANKSLLSSIQAKFIGIDEVYLKEKGRRIYGLLVVDLPSRVILTLERATNRTSDTWKGVLARLTQVKDSLQVIVSDLARAFPALVRKLKKAWKRPVLHQLCNVHAMRCLLRYKSMVWNDYRTAKQRLDKAQKALEKKPDDKEAQDEYWSARQLVKFHWRMVRFCLSLISQVISALRKPNKQEAEEQLDEVLQKITTLPCEYEAFGKKLTNFINNYRQKLLLHLELSDLDWTTNSCEAVFSLLRRFTIVYKCFPNKESTNRFFSLFVLYYNLKQQHYSDGTYMTPLAKAGVQVKGSYLYYLGYEEPSQIISYSKLALAKPRTMLASQQKLSTRQTMLPLAA